MFDESNQVHNRVPSSIPGTVFALLNTFTFRAFTVYHSTRIVELATAECGDQDIQLMIVFCAVMFREVSGDSAYFSLETENANSSHS